MFTGASEESKKLRSSFLTAFLGTAATASPAVVPVEVVVGVADAIGTANGSKVAVGKHKLNVDVGCFDSKCALASVFVLVSIICV